MHRTKVTIVEEALDANNTIATANRADFDRHGVKVINFMSAPGAGKTTLLERVGRDVPGVRVGVLEGDVQGSMDADRLAYLHVPVVQLNTDSGFGGECHLDANMVRSAIPALPLHDIDLLIIENVGNLVCPAEFKIGEDVRVMVCSVTEGEDKPLKYPLMFRACELVIVNKVDLLPHLDFDLEQLPLQHRPGSSRRRADRRQRPDRRGHRRVAGLAGRGGRAGTRGRGRMNPAVGSDRIQALLDRAHRGQRDVLRRRSGSLGAALPPDGRALRSRRAPDRARCDPGRTLRRPPRRRRVRASGDRRQARAAGDRPGRRRRRAGPSGRAACPARRHRDRLRHEGRRRRARARVPDHGVFDRLRGLGAE